MDKYCKIHDNIAGIHPDDSITCLKCREESFALLKSMKMPGHDKTLYEEWLDRRVTFSG